MNISFVKLGEEECERCDLHKRHLETHKPEEVPDDGKENNKRTVNLVRILYLTLKLLHKPEKVTEKIKIAD